MKRLTPLAGLLAACGSSVAPTLEPLGAHPPAPRLEATATAPIGPGLALRHLRQEGGLVAVDLEANGLTRVYGLALRFELTGARLVRGEPAGSPPWPIARFEPTASGAVGVLSESGAAFGRTLDGTVATLWLELDAAGEGSLTLDAARTGVVDPSLRRTAPGTGAVRWAWR